MSKIEGNAFRLGTRKSALALVQSNQVRSDLEKIGVHCKVIEVVSSGDKDRQTPLYELDPDTPGLFTKQLEVALLDGSIDLAVHSLKDLPTDQPAGLKVAAVPTRVVSHDCLITAAGATKAKLALGLPEGATVGTSSLRREAQLLAVRPDLKIVPIRGNVPTRVQAVRDDKVTAVVLAEAGLLRLGLSLDGLERITLDDDRFVPAPGQGALAIETRTELSPGRFDVLSDALAKLHDPISAQETRIERNVLKGLHGGCTLPLGVRCTVDRKTGIASLKAFLGVSRDRRQAPHDWLSFHHFDIENRQEETLIREAVTFFKQFMG